MNAYRGGSDLEIKSNDPEGRGIEEGIDDGKESIERSNHKQTAAFRTQIASPLPVEQRLRARIDLFLNRYGLSPMGRAIALHWIQVRDRAPCINIRGALEVLGSGGAYAEKTHDGFLKDTATADSGPPQVEAGSSDTCLTFLPCNFP